MYLKGIFFKFLILLEWINMLALRKCIAYGDKLKPNKQ